MNLVKIHKEELKKILDAIQFNGVAFGASKQPVLTHHSVNFKRFPAIRVLGGIQTSEPITNCNDKVMSRYRVQVCMQYAQDPQGAEDVIDQVCSQVTDALRNVPIGSNAKWMDLNWETQVDLMQEADLIIYKEITVEAVNFLTRQNPAFT